MSELFDLSSEQRRLWQSARPGAPQISRAVWRVAGPLDQSRLEEATARAIERHEILVTSMRRRVGLKVPFQAPGSAEAPKWLPVEIAAADESEALAQLAAEAAAEAFDLDSGPVVHLTRRVLGEDRHLLAVTAPSLLADSWSLALLIGEIAHYYGGVGCEPAAEPLQYLDFAAWQEELRQSEEESARAGRTYWQEHARSVEIRLPFERSGSVMEGLHELPLKPLDRERAGALAAQLGGSVDSALESFLAASWLAFLARLDPRPEISFAACVDGRPSPDLEGGLGPYARWVPVTLAPVLDQPLARFAGEARRALHQASERQLFFVPTEGEAAPAVGFELVRLPAALEGTGFSWSCVEAGRESEPWKLLLAATLDKAGEVSLRIRYDAARLDLSEARRLGNLFSTLLSAAFADPEVAIGRLPLLAPSERTRLLADPCDPSAEVVPDLFLALFDRQVATTPEVAAVVCGDRRLSYRDLDRRANRMAHRLRELGVGPDDRVALVLDRSVDYVAALIGTLKAGGAYVPLEPDQPLRRLGALLDDVAPRAVVSQEKLIDRLPQDRRNGALVLDRDERLAAASSDGPRVEIAPSQLMYVIFTSGSTGVPKGVGVEHRQLANYLRGIRACLDPPPASFAMVSTFAADLGHTALFPTLASGGCLHIVTVADATDGAAFAALAQREEFAALKIVPSHLEALLTSRDPSRSLPTRVLVLGGEASRWDLIERIRDLRPGLRVINHYGPTETTVGVATHPVSERLPYAATVPLGRPLAGTRFRILDPDQEPVPEGVAGELFVAGSGVARGYLGRPDATAERFVPDPFAVEPGARMYRTGDRARHLPDRSVEFLGRVDSQVKFHGFRVELNEIRLALNAHRSVRDSVVMLRRDGQGRDALVCYYVSRQEIEVEELRRFLAESILEQTLPNVFVHLKRLPLTLNGKVNPAALPGLDEVRRQVGRILVAPRNAIETQIAAIWTEVLGVERLGVDDNFFELGGHSLLATRALSRLREVFAVDVPLRSLFEEPTIAGLARAMTAAAPLEAGPGIASDGDSLERQLVELEGLSDEQARSLLGTSSTGGTN